MSYSRWGSSRWYTYWSIYPSGEEETCDTAVFVVDGVASFSAKELRENPEQCLERVREWGSEEGQALATDADILELWGYINAFLTDVDEEFAARGAPDERT